MTNPSLENVAVMGAGAVGCYFGAMLARAGATVRLIGRPALVDAVSRDGLRFDGVKFKGSVPLSATTWRSLRATGGFTVAINGITTAHGPPSARRAAASASTERRSDGSS